MNPLSYAQGIDWESILPVLLFVGYGIVQMIGALKGNKEEEEDTAKEDPEAMERARRIREEIRERIRKRMEGVEGSETPVGSPSPSPAYDPNLPEQMQGRRTVESAPRQRLELPSQRRTREPREIEERPLEMFDPLSGGGESMIQRQLAEQQRRLEEAKAERQSAIERAKEIRGKAAATPVEAVRRPPKRDFWNVVPSTEQQFDDLLAGLRSAGGLRNAILYQEILGTPKGLRLHSEREMP